MNVRLSPDQLDRSKAVAMAALAESARQLAESAANLGFSNEVCLSKMMMTGLKLQYSAGANVYQVPPSLSVPPPTSNPPSPSSLSHRSTPHHLIPSTLPGSRQSHISLPFFLPSPPSLPLPSPRRRPTLILSPFSNGEKVFPSL